MVKLNVSKVILDAYKAREKAEREIERSVKRVIGASVRDGTQIYKRYARRVLDRPTSYTINGIRPVYPGASAERAYARGWIRSPSPAIVIMPKQWQWLMYQVEGGIRKAKAYLHGLPIGLGRRNKYGNTVGLKHLVRRFSGPSSRKQGRSVVKVKGFKVGFAGRKPVILFVPQAVYRPRLRWESILDRIISKQLARHTRRVAGL